MQTKEYYRKRFLLKRLETQAKADAIEKELVVDKLALSNKISVVKSSLL